MHTEVEIYCSRVRYVQSRVRYAQLVVTDQNRCQSGTKIREQEFRAVPYFAGVGTYSDLLTVSASMDGKH